MNPDRVNEFAGFIALTVAVPTLLFTIIYGVASPWYKSWLGRTLFGVMFSITFLFCFIFSRRLFGKYFLYEWGAVLAYTMLAVSFWSFLIILIVERRAGRGLELDLSRHTEPHDIIPAPDSNRKE